MTTPIQDAVLVAMAAVHAVAAEAVVYWRGDLNVSLSGVKSETDVEIVEGDGSIIVARVTDWRFKAADLMLEGEQVRPRRGDRIEYTTLAGESVTYEVLPVAGRECFRFTEGSESELRVHTKLVEA